MSLLSKSSLIRPFAWHISRSLVKEQYHILQIQQDIFHKILSKTARTSFGIEFGIEKKMSLDIYNDRLAIRDYEDYIPFINRISQGEKNVLWPRLPQYFVGTSGTTTGVKYIPQTRESLPFHFSTARNAALNYCYQNKLLEIFDGNLLFLSGSPELYMHGKISTGRLSGIINHVIPQWLRTNHLPSLEVNKTANWEDKIHKVVKECLTGDLRMISGIPPWLLMFLEKSLDISGKSTIKDVYPNLKLCIHGGVNFQPYQHRFDALIGKKMHYLDTFPASEGFLGYQLEMGNEFSLAANAGSFFQFLRFENGQVIKDRIIGLPEVELGQNYAVVMSTFAGFHNYVLGDVIKFTSIDPYRFKYVGRTSAYISAFGEHVTMEDVEWVIEKYAQLEKFTSVTEYTVCPNIQDDVGSKPFHEWFIEFHEIPDNLDEIASTLDKLMMGKNFHYADLRNGNIIAKLQIRLIPPGRFIKSLLANNIIDGQNKIPRIRNDRKIADLLVQHSTDKR